MASLELVVPEKRLTVLYSRITEKNKKFLEKVAAKKGVSESVLVDHIISTYRNENASNKKKPKGSH